MVRIVETAEDGWESPSWYAVREIPGTPGGYALARLGTRRLYRVRLGSTPEQSTCECLGSGGNGSTLCRHVGALWKLDRAGRLCTPEREDKMTEKEYKQLQAEAKAEAARLPSEGDETHYLLTLSGSIDDMPCGLFKTAAAAVAVATGARMLAVDDPGALDDQGNAAHFVIEPNPALFDPDAAEAANATPWNCFGRLMTVPETED